MRVVVMNIQSGVGTTKGWWQYLTDFRYRFMARPRTHLRRIGTALSDADLLLLTEVDGGSTRTGGLNQAAFIADRSGLDYAFFPCFTCSRMRQGNAVLSRGVKKVRNHRLPGPGEPRFLSEARVGDVRMFVAHTSLKIGVRKKQLEHIHRIVSRRDGSVILGGDFNARDVEELDELSASLFRVRTGPTFPSWRPRWNLDHLLVSQDFEVERAGVLALRASDHLAIYADLQNLQG